MTRRERLRRNQIAVLDALATEIESHIANGSAFIYDGADDDEIKLREDIIQHEADKMRAAARRLAGRKRE